MDDVSDRQSISPLVKFNGWLKMRAQGVKDKNHGKDLVQQAATTSEGYRKPPDFNL